MATTLLLDGHSLAYRAWFALQETGMRTASGQETQAIYGFVSMVTKLLDDFGPRGLAVAFDRPEPTFRDEIALDYKAGRAATPDPLRAQIELIRRFVEALGVPVVDAVGFEADDVLATLATFLRDAGEEVVIVTGDRDAFQLVEDPHVRVLYNRRGVTDYVLYDEAGILERTGVAPVDYPFLAALRGDTSDNLPGVPGVGEKTAAKLVTTYRDVDTLYSRLSECTPKLRQSLADSEEQVRRNLLMTPVVRDVPLSLTVEDFTIGRSDRVGSSISSSPCSSCGPHATACCRSSTGSRALPPRRWPPRPRRKPVRSGSWTARPEPTPTSKRWRAGANPSALEAAYAAAPGRSAIEGLALVGSDEEEAVYLPGELLGEAGVAAAFSALVGARSKEPRIVAHRSKELMRSLLEEGIDLADLRLDTAVAAYLVDPAEGMASLEDLATRCGLAYSAGEVGPASAQLGFDLDGTAVEAVAAACARAELIARLAAVLESELAEIEATALFEEIERPLIRVLAKMEVAGVGVDVDRLREMNTALTDEARTLEKQIQQIAGMDFNVNSTTQLRTVLYDKLGLRPQRRTKTGYSTDAQTLEKLRGEHEIVDALLRYREVEKLRSTYGDGLLAEVAPDGRIHASFNQTVARTGRLSSDQPNLHNIPVRTEEGRRFREAFVAGPDHELLVADYNQIELRVIAHLSEDPGLVGAFAAGEDIHSTTAARIFSVEPAAITAAMRSKSKMVSYGLAYGMEAYGLAQRLAIGVDEAAEILAQYFRAFPAVKAYMEGTVAEAKRRGYTETERGRRRYLPELASDNFRVRQAAERQAMNAGIQGLAADIFKLALVALDRALEEQGLAARIVLQVHDEVIVEAPAPERAEVERLTLAAMHEAYPLSVPLEVNLSWNRSWADAK